MTKTKIKMMQNELVKEITPMFQDFIGFKDERVKISKEIRDFKDGEYLNYVETSYIIEHNSLCTLEIKRIWDLNDENGFGSNAVNIRLSWFDGCDELCYQNDYAAQLSNKAVAERVKVLIDTGKKLAKVSWKLHKKEKDMGYGYGI